MENFVCGSKEVELVLVEDENNFMDPLETFLDSEDLQMDENKLQLNDDVYSDFDLLRSQQAGECELTTLTIITSADIVKIDVKSEHNIDSCSGFDYNNSNDIYISTSNMKSESKASNSDYDKKNDIYSDKMGSEPCNALDSNHHRSRKIDEKGIRNGAKKLTRSVIIEEKPTRKNNASEIIQDKLVEFQVRPDPKRVSP